MITLLLGGSRSGKSALAERLAGGSGEPVCYVATLIVGATDNDGLSRIAAHRKRRPQNWATVEIRETQELIDTLSEPGTVLIDSLGPWVANAPDMGVPTQELCKALASRTGDTVVVSDEVGLSVHPSSEPGRRFRDALGELNQQIAEVADEVLLVVAGRVLRLE